MLNKAFDVAEEVLIGVVSDEMIKKDERKVKEFVQTFKERVSGLMRYLEAKGFLRRANIFPLFDFYGPAINDADLDVIIVSQETVKRAHEINEIRLKRGLRRLDVLIIPLIKAEDGEPISSTRIRLGEIDREGRILKKVEDR